MKIRLLFILPALVLVAACAPLSQVLSQAAPTAVSEAPAAAQWRLSSFTTGGQEIAALVPYPITLQFNSGGMVTGLTGCNSYSAAYAVQGNNIVLTQIATTARACAAAEAAQQEQRFLQALASTNSYQVSSGRLIIAYHSTDKLTFVAAPAASLPPSTVAASPTPANTPALAPAVSWKREHFGTFWNVAFPSDWKVNDAGASEGTVSLDGPYGGHTYEIGLAFPLGVDATSLDAWVQQQVSAVPDADRTSVEVSDTTVAGAPAKRVLNMPTANGAERTHNVYIWKVGDAGPRFIVIAQTDGLPLDAQAMTRLLDDFLFQMR